MKFVISGIQLLMLMKSYYQPTTYIMQTTLYFPILTLLFQFSSILGQNISEKGNLILEDIPEITLDIKTEIMPYQNTRSAVLSDWNPNGQEMLIITRFGNTYQFHVVNKPMGVRKQITFFEDQVGYGTFCPSEKHKGFLFTKDKDGNEMSQIYWYNSDEYTSTLITDGYSKNFGPVWSNGGEKFAYSSNKNDGKHFNVYISNIENPVKAERITENKKGYWYCNDWSSDDKSLILTQYLSITHSNLYFYNTESEKLIRLNKNESETVFSFGLWSKNGNEIFLITNQNRKFNTLSSYSIQDNTLKYLTDNINWDITKMEINPSRDKIAFVANEDGISKLYLLNLNNYRYEQINNIPIGQINSLNFHPSENKLGLVLNTSQSPGDVYVYNIDNKEKVQWTKSEIGGLNSENFSVPELNFYETFDSINGKPRKIPAFITKPQNTPKPYPVVINIHGGPESQYNPYFSPFTAYLTNELGVAVIAPNVRGSSGYGKDYVKLDNGYKREESVKDIGMLLNWIKNNPDFDESRIAVMGGSYGGYMVLSSLIKYYDLLRCGIDIVGISNFVTFLENTQEYRKDVRRAEYGDERIPEMREFLNRISPTTNADKINKPLFIIQGANDPRVPENESQQMVDIIRKNGGKVWYMLAKDEGHGYKKKENRDYMMNAMALFLKLYLLEQE